MSETIFSCPCGMTLKVYGDDQVGKTIECPGCKASVVVPAPGQTVAAPPEDDGGPPYDEEFEAPQSQTGSLIYLSFTSITTVLIVLFFLIPALKGSATAGRKGVAEQKSPDDPLLKRGGGTATGPVVNRLPRSKKLRSRLDSALPEYTSDPQTGPALATTTGSAPAPKLAVPGKTTDRSPTTKKGEPVRPAPKARYSLLAQTMLNQAKTYEKSRKIDSALTTYRDVVKDFPDTEQAAFAQGRLKVLEKNEKK